VFTHVCSVLLVVFGAQMEAWVGQLRAKLDEEFRSAESELRHSFSVEAEKILVEMANIAEIEHNTQLRSIMTTLQSEKNRRLTDAAKEVCLPLLSLLRPSYLRAPISAVTSRRLDAVH
jgi:hypothetical protein